MTEFKEVQLVEQKDLRDQCINRIETLNEVRKLFLIPEMEVMTTKMVADYYKVTQDVIKMCYFNYKSEIKPDGVVVKRVSEMKDLCSKINLPYKSQQGKIVFMLDNITVEIPNAGITCFSKRAILRIGMLLRDSPVAKEVRTQLLNVFKHSTAGQKTFEIDEEDRLMLKILHADDKEKIVMALSDYKNYKNRYIKKIENTNVELVQANEVLHSDNKALAGDILEWSDRACLNKAVRTLASKVHKPFGYIFKELYDELRYKQNIGLSQRGKPPYIQYIKESEWKQVMQSFSAICENNGCSATKIIQKARTDHKSIKNLKVEDKIL